MSLSAILYFANVDHSAEDRLRSPNNGDIANNKMGDKEDKQKSLKDEWFDMMHLTAPGQSWEAIEYENQIRRIDALKDSPQRDEIDIADGLIKGEWYERGSNNQAGSVVVTEYVDRSGPNNKMSDG